MSFVHMADGTAADYDRIDAEDRVAASELPDRILAHMELLAHDDGAYRIDRLQHALQTATRAERDGADADWIAAALVHDLGDVLCPQNHGPYAAAILRPYVREEVCQVVAHHPIFQQHYFANRSPAQRAARERYRNEPWYEATVEFCARWDQRSFDPAYDTLPLEHFAPVLREVFTRGL